MNLQNTNYVMKREDFLVHSKLRGLMNGKTLLIIWVNSFPSVLWHCWKGIRPVKQLGVRLLVVTIWSFAHLIAPVVTTTSGILSSNKIQKGDLLVSANPDPSGKLLLTWSSRLLRHGPPDVLAKAQCWWCGLTYRIVSETCFLEKVHKNVSRCCHHA